MNCHLQSSKRGFGLPISPEIDIFDLFAELKEMQERACNKPDEAQNKLSGIISFDNATDDLGDDILFEDELSHTSEKE